MTGLIAEARRNLAGVYAMLAFKPGWRDHFDVGADGMIRSFSAALVALPAFALLAAASNHFLAHNPDLAGEATGLTLTGAALQYARIWLLFPPVALIVTLVLGLKTGLFAWITVHNWTVTALLALQALIWTLYAAGLAGIEALSVMLALYQVVRLAVHWRVAHGALGLPWGMSAGAACIPLVVDALIVYAVAG